MPLSDNLPVIDDRTYADIVEEVRARVPRYTDEWTDLNESDPGMAMVELFAWLSEMQIFRMGQVPLLNYLKFLELVGIELDPARPSTSLVTFPVDPGFGQPTTIVPALTQLATEEPDADGPILFELDRALVVIRAQLEAVQSFDGFVFRDLSEANAADGTTGFSPFGTAFGPDTAFYIGFSEQLPDQSFDLTVWADNAESGVPVLRCGGSGAFERSRLNWEIWDGREWRAVTLLKDDTQALTRTGQVSLKGPAQGLSQPQALGRVATPMHWLRAKVVRNDYQKTPHLRAIRTNTGRVTQAETLEFESLGGSNGETNQVFSLADAPVLPNSQVIQVNEGREYVDWQEVPDFAGSGPNDPHYVLNRATGEVRFGNGRSGRIPVGNPRTPRNIRALSYQVGGGARGNVAPGQINALQSAIEGLDEDGIGNLFAAAGGTDEETLQAAMERAPSTLKSRERAVAADDFEQLSLRAANVIRARALPLFHPDYPGIDVPGVVTIVIVPDVDEPAPMPTEGTLNAVCAILNERRLLTTELYVTGPVYQEVTVTAEIIVEDNADLAEVKEQALDSLALYFDARKGGEGSDPTLPEDDPAQSGGGWPFGGDIYYSLLYRRLLTVGVKRIHSLELRLDKDDFGACQDVPVPPGVLLVSGAHQIDVRYDDDAAEAGR
ncbi:putative baseplate assembly protein [Tateyamaria omphalii]|uniref:Putative baseplate assembly protein n=1 Tax=Tateyamaria omphalii TaxID=299262 RepID=A0A1P8MVC1_9RHOB|nr:putative baseplate assembly protein [Tateyamaria omphalii]APX11978.1 putative baseplate assembly protein [Tateyamaria omphalii]